jgi:hypothetical protein
MSKPRKEFWEFSKYLIDYSTEIELTVLRQMAAKELESRISKFHEKIDRSEMVKKLKRNKLMKEKFTNPDKK